MKSKIKIVMIFLKISGIVFGILASLFLMLYLALQSFTFMFGENSPTSGILTAILFISMAGGVLAVWLKLEDQK